MLETCLRALDDDAAAAAELEGLDLPRDVLPEEARGGENAVYAAVQHALQLVDDVQSLATQVRILGQDKPCSMLHMVLPHAVPFWLLRGPFA